jgi:hypothetical protein
MENLENLKCLRQGTMSRMKDLLTTDNLLELKKTKELYDLVSQKIGLIEKEFNVVPSETLKFNCDAKDYCTLASFTELSPAEFLKPKQIINYFVKEQKDSQEIDQNLFKKVDFGEENKNITQKQVVPSIQVNTGIFDDNLKEVLSREFNGSCFENPIAVKEAPRPEINDIVRPLIFHPESLVEPADKEFYL